MQYKKIHIDRIYYGYRRKLDIAKGSFRVSVMTKLGDSKFINRGENCSEVKFLKDFGDVKTQIGLEK